MPSRNTVRIDIPQSYYHIYARGINRSDIFADASDYGTFLNLFKRYLSVDSQRDRIGVSYKHFYNQLELLCFCLMSNHFHLLVYQETEGAIAQLMQGVMISYSRYFNKKYQRTGPLFETRYKASLIRSQPYLEHVSRYIHLNPTNWREHPYSSLPFYRGWQHADWLRPARILEQFSSRQDYLTFLEDYEDHKRTLDTIKHELADYSYYEI